MIARTIPFLLFFFFCNYSTAQSDIPNYSLLYEIKGPKSMGSSYVFGSCHLNDPRIFNFSDSLYHAFSSCDAFAAEVQIDSFNVLLMDLFKQKFIEEQKAAEQDSIGSNNSAIEEDSIITSRSNEYFDPKGMPTFLDAYLGHAAKNSGMEIFGLEVFEDQKNMLGAFEDKDDTFRFGSPVYENLIDWYIEGDLTAAAEKFGDPSDHGDYDMINRNKIQAKSIIALSEKRKLFAVIGAGHLYGKDNVLDLLKKAGYEIRKVNFGRRTDQMEKLYSSHSKSLDSGFYTTKIDNKLTIKSSFDSKILFATPQIKMCGTMDMGLGCLWADMVIPVYKDQVSDLSEVIKNFLPDTINFNLIGEEKTDLYEMMEFRYDSPQLHAGYRIHRAVGMLVVQMIITFAEPTLDNLSEELRFSKLHFKPGKQNDKIEYSEKYGVEYFFPVVEELALTTAYYNSDTLAGKMYLEYKTAFNKKTQDEYMIQLSQLPGGYLYSNIEESLLIIKDSYAERLGLDVTKLERIVDNGAEGLLIDGDVKSDPKIKVFLKILIRGNQGYLAMNYARSGNKDNKFLDALKCRDLSIGTMLNHRIDDLSMTFQSPATDIIQREKYGTKDWFFVDSSFASSLVITEIDFGEYESYLFNEDSLSNDRIAFENQVDSLISYEGIYMDGDLLGSQTIYTMPDQAVIYGELYLYYGSGGAQVLVYTPEIDASINYINDVFSSMSIDNAKLQKEKLATDKSELFFQHLTSKDTVLQKEVESYSSYYPYDSTHLSALYSVLEGVVYDENSERSMKHSLLDNVFNLPFNINRIIEIYKQQTNLDTKKKIIQKLISSKQLENIEVAFELFNEDKSEVSGLPGYSYFVFKDSVELLIAFREDLMALVNDNINKEHILPIFATNLNKMNHLPNYTKDSILVANYYTEFTISQCDSLIADSTYYIPQSIFDYHGVNNNHPSFKKLQSTIENHGTIYEKNQLFKTTLSRGAQLSNDRLLELLDHPVYYNNVLKEYKKMDMLSEIPSKYLDREYAAITTAKSNFFEYGYDLDILNNEVLSYDVVIINGMTTEMAFVKLSVKNKEEVLYGLVGPFNENNFVDENNNQSVYYTEIATKDSASDILESLKKYFEK